MNRLTRRLAVVLTLALLLAPLALAAEEEHADPAQTPAGFIFRWINSIIVIAAAVWAFRKMRGSFRATADSISTAINQAAVAKQQAERRVREVEEKLARLGEEVAALKAEAQRDAAAEAEKIRALAREEALKVDRAALAEIEATQRSARLELKALAARLAVERAEALIRARLTPETQAALLRGFTEDLARSVN